MAEFDGVVPTLVQALSKRGYSALTPVQKAVLAPELIDADLLVSAQTGSGKTVAFGMSLAPTLLDGSTHFKPTRSPLALCVAPTRELALQVKRELEWLYEIAGVVVASCVGGMDMRSERRVLERGAHIVVGTPGRLLDHIKRGSLVMSGLRAVVLDEADEMLDLGFREELEAILGVAPKNRRTLMFSATVPLPIVNLAKRYQRDAVRVSTTAEQKQHLDIEYRALSVAGNDQENAIVNVLRYFEAKNALVFCATRATVNHMVSRFNNRGFSVVALSGELSQNERTHALQALRDGRARVCIATDVAARGLDLPNLELVIHADIPKNHDILLHRSGRTGRAGRKGVSALIVPHSARKRTERLLQRANIVATWGRPPSVEDVLKRDQERIFEDPVLSDVITQDEKAFSQELLDRYDAQHIAAAFVRLYRAGQSAPEELIDPGVSSRSGRPDRPGRSGRPDRPGRSDRSDRSDRPDRTDKPDRPPRTRDVDFEGSVWFKLSVGRKDEAEPRWLLPVLCKAGQMTKKAVGAIKILQHESYVEIAPKNVDKFIAAIGPDNVVDKTITVTRMDGAPNVANESPRKKYQGKPRDNHREKPREYSRSKPAEKKWQKPRKEPQSSEHEKSAEQPSHAHRTDDKTVREPVGKKAYTSNFASKPGKKTTKKSAKKGAKKTGKLKAGNSPLKRKKTKRANNT